MFDEKRGERLGAIGRAVGAIGERLGNNNREVRASRLLYGVECRVSNLELVFDSQEEVTSL